MFLKRLETVGFKSFAERVQVEFVAGVTAVVGPNGSGKSNIIDAIRWVLGEQSARSLRGKKMEDIIFQGSETRNPLNFAEVSLLLNNKDKELPIDYEEVNIKRRVYRSGESEFFINKQACRLKDIVDLFMDTGLGRESFSIIGQGKIDEILSSKAEERRAVFEEAAGVLKYKQRKTQAEFKLGETADNLDRVDDIVYEIEQQIEPLKEQAAIAKKYKEKKKVLKEIEIALLVTEIAELHVKWQQVLEEIKEKRHKELEQKTAIQKREAQLAEDLQYIQGLEEKMNSLQSGLLTVTEQLEQFEGKRNVVNERFKHLHENKQKLLEDKKMKSDRIADVNERITNEQAQLEKVNESIKKAQEEMNQLIDRLNKQPDIVEAKIEDLKSDYIEFLNERAVLENDEQTVKKQLDQIENRSAGNSAYYERLAKEENTLSDSKNTLKESVEQLTEQIKIKEKEIAETRENIRAARQKDDIMQQQLSKGNEQIAKMASRKEMLEEMKDSFQGYFYGVKEILQAMNEKRLSDIYGAVVDLINVPSEYMTAIDTILGAQAQYIVVPNDEIARKTIHWLKEENKGRATFLPLASIEARVIPPHLVKKLEEKDGYIGLASELVQVEPPYKLVTAHLMGNVVVTKDLQSANTIAKLTNRRYRVVTLEGDVVYPGGSMSGGAKRKNKQSLFTREKEIKIVNEKLERSLIRRDQFIEEIEEVRESMNKRESLISENEKELAQLKLTLQTTQKQYNECAIKYQAVAEELKIYRLNEEQSKENSEKLHGQLVNITKSLSKLNNKITVTEEKIEKLTTEQQHIQHNEKSLEKRIHELQVIIAEQEERKKNNLDRLDTLNFEITELKGELASINNQLNELLTPEQMENRMKELEKMIQSYRAQRQEISLAVEQVREERKQKMQLAEDEEREIKQLNKLHEQFVSTIQKQEIEANRLDVTLENHLTFLQTEYTITFEKAANEYAKVEDIQTAKNEVKALKQSIKHLGTVNLGAIEEYDRLKDRYAFLLEQKRDLTEAKETLYAVIKEMDKEMTERFGTMFKDIQAAFTEVFKQLFGGGYAELTLTEPDNLLETGIEIVARPPGKKLRTLGLLSGGERALTAIALLFAILRARPVPFCILDEVDAALDEANVERFGNYLRRFSHETQFIVITHRKGTMEEADALYGVTMQESGVSRLVSVKLEDTADLMEAT